MKTYEYKAIAVCVNSVHDCHGIVKAGDRFEATKRVQSAVRMEYAGVSQVVIEMLEESR